MKSLKPILSKPHDVTHASKYVNIQANTHSQTYSDSSYVSVFVITCSSWPLLISLFLSQWKSILYYHSCSSGNRCMWHHQVWVWLNYTMTHHDNGKHVANLQPTSCMPPSTQWCRFIVNVDLFAVQICVLHKQTYLNQFPNWQTYNTAHNTSKSPQFTLSSLQSKLPKFRSYSPIRYKIQGYALFYLVKPRVCSFLFLVQK